MSLKRVLRALDSVKFWKKKFKEKQRDPELLSIRSRKSFHLFSGFPYNGFLDPVVRDPAFIQD